MLKVELEPGEELCTCETCQRLAHEPMSLRIPRSRYHKVLDAKAKRQDASMKRPQTNDTA